MGSLRPAALPHPGPHSLGVPPEKTLLHNEASVCIDEFDPETGVWRRVEVFLRKKGRRYEIYDVRGLKIRRETPSGA